MVWYLRNGAASTLEELTGLELMGYLADLQGLGLAPDTVHGCFETPRRLPIRPRVSTTRLTPPC